MAPIPTPRLPLWLRALHSSARYTATASVRGLLVAEIQVFVPYRIHPSIQRSPQDRTPAHKCRSPILEELLCGLGIRV